MKVIEKAISNPFEVLKDEKIDRTYKELFFLANVALAHFVKDDYYSALEAKLHAEFLVSVLASIADTEREAIAEALKDLAKMEESFAEDSSAKENLNDGIQKLTQNVEKLVSKLNDKLLN